MAQPAHVIAVGLDPALNASIQAWFRQFNHLPPVPLMAAKIDIVAPSKATFAELMRIMAASPQKNFILIIHGHSDGSGLFLRLTAAQRRPHTSFHDLRRLVDFDEDGDRLDRRDRGVMGISASDVDALVELRQEVQARKINCIEFRACNLGRNPVSLDGFRRFFGARRAGAPNIHSFFGIVPAVSDARLLTRHEREHRGHHWETYKFPSAYKSPELVACFELNELQKPEYGGHIAADNPATLAAWVKTHIMANGAPSGRTMAMHGLWIADIAIADNGKTRYVPAAIDMGEDQLSSPLGGWGGPEPRRFIPPLSPLYKKHIVYAG